MNLLHAIERHLATTGVSARRFGIEVAGDPRLVADMRRGRQVRPAMEARVRAAIGRRTQ